MTAERAFLDNFILRIERSRAVRACRNAHLAADTLLFVDQNLTVLCLIGGAGRTDLHAGRVSAVLADGRKEILLHVGILPDRTDGQHFVVIHAHRHIILELAGRFAGVTADTAV